MSLQPTPAPHHVSPARQPQELRRLRRMREPGTQYAEQHWLWTTQPAASGRQVTRAAEASVAAPPASRPSDAASRRRRDCIVPSDFARLSKRVESMVVSPRRVRGHRPVFDYTGPLVATVWAIRFDFPDVPVCAGPRGRSRGCACAGSSNPAWTYRLWPVCLTSAASWCLTTGEGSSGGQWSRWPVRRRPGRSRHRHAACRRSIGNDRDAP